MKNQFVVKQSMRLGRLGLTVWLALWCFPVGAQANPEFRTWLLEQQRSFSSFRDQQDADFARFLAERWVAFDLFVQQPPATEPKPQVLPEWTEPQVEVPEPRIPPADAQPPVDIAAPLVTNPLPEPVLPTPQASAGNVRYALQYEGLRAEFRARQRLNTTLPVRPGQRWTQQHITTFWNRLSGWQDADELNRLIAELARRHALNSYDRLLVTHAFAGQIAPEPDAQTLLTWYLMLRQGAQVRVAFDAQGLYLLAATRQAQYNVPYISYDGVRFYVVGADNDGPFGPLTSYPTQHQRASSFLELTPHESLLIADDWTERRVSIPWNGSAINLALPVSPALVRHVQQYPQMALQDYFTLPMPRVMRESLRRQLAPYLVNRSPQAQAELLLRVSQWITGYQTDQAQFGREYYQHPVESFSNGLNDCEDRTLILVQLLRHFTELDVVVLYFPGHVAAAVRLPPTDLSGIDVGNASFYFADPSYLNAPLGKLIPQAEGLRPRLIGVP
ncbi:hypothetical protein ACFOSD_03885 [Salinispirillum marinum]|uniref:Transglutaminase-like domain-containing protein n=2 Tax=Saccharospirillaceae TaxID=255527 RepID=A0ABV8BBF0_9GAMM